MGKYKHWSLRNPRRIPIDIEWIKRRIVIDERGCWLWDRGMTEGGYPSVSGNNYKPIRVNRLVWSIVNGPIPDGLYVCHQCDVKRCVNPDHLYLATAKQNIRDAITRGLINHATMRRRIGEDNHKAKLTEADVLFIRSSPMTQAVLSEMFNVRETNIQKIVARATWKHI